MEARIKAMLFAVGASVMCVVAADTSEYPDMAKVLTPLLLTMPVSRIRSGR